MIILSLCILVLGCKKEPTSWKTDLSIPLLRTSLGLENFLADTLLSGNPGDTAFINYDLNILELKVDSLLELPNDSISKSFSIAPLTQFTFNPGQVFFTNTDEFNIDGSGAELTNVLVDNGVLFLNASNMVDADIVIRISIPNATLGAQPFSFEVIIPAGEGSNIAALEDSIRFDDYALDLTGVSGFENNVLSVNFSIKIADYEIPTTVFNSDLVEFTIKYDDLTLKYAEGYLGTRQILFNESFEFNGLDAFGDALLNFGAARLFLTFENQFGVDVSANITEITATNSSSQQEISLSHSLINGSLNLIRANYASSQIFPFPRTYSITDQNSNLLDFLNIIPNSINIQGSANINPLGNISNYNDWASSMSSISGNLYAQIPLELGLSNLVLADTLDFEWKNESEEIQTFKLMIAATNSFPADATLSGQILDSEGSLLLELSELLTSPESGLIAGSENGINGETLLKYFLSESDVAKLNQAALFSFRIKLDSRNYPEVVSFQIDDRIDLIVSAELITKIEIE